MERILATESLLTRLFDSTGTFRLGVVCKMTHRPMLRHAFRVLQQQPSAEDVFSQDYMMWLHHVSEYTPQPWGCLEDERLESQRRALERKVHQRKHKLEKLIVCAALHGNWDECLPALENIVHTDDISRELFPVFARLSKAPPSASQQRLYSAVEATLRRCFERAQQSFEEDSSSDSEAKGKGKGKGEGSHESVALSGLAAVVVAACLIDVKSPWLDSARDMVRSRGSRARRNQDDYLGYDDYDIERPEWDCGDYSDYDDLEERKYRRCHAADHLRCEPKADDVPRDMYDTEAGDTFAFSNTSRQASQVYEVAIGDRCSDDPVDEELFVHIDAAFDSSSSEMLDIVFVNALLPAISNMNVLCASDAKSTILDEMSARVVRSKLLPHEAKKLADACLLVKVLLKHETGFGPDVPRRLRRLSLSDENQMYDESFWRSSAEVQLSKMKYYADDCSNNQLCVTQVEALTNSIVVAIAVGVEHGVVDAATAYLTRKLAGTPATKGVTKGFGKGQPHPFPLLLESALEQSLTKECWELELNNDAILCLAGAMARLTASERKLMTPCSAFQIQTSGALQALTHHEPKDIGRMQLACTALIQHGARFDFETFATLLTEEQRTQKEPILETWKESAVQQLLLVLDSSTQDIVSQDGQGRGWEPSVLANALLSAVAVGAGGLDVLRAQRALTHLDIKGLSKKLVQECLHASSNPKRVLNMFYVKALVESRADPCMHFKVGKASDSAFTSLSRMEACRLGVHEAALLFLKRDVRLQGSTIISMLHKVPASSDDAVQWETVWRDTAASHLQAKLRAEAESEKKNLPHVLVAAIAAGVAAVEVARKSVPEGQLRDVLYYFLSLGCRNWILESREVETIESWLKFGAATDLFNHDYTPLELVALKFKSKNPMGACRVATALASAGAQCTARALSALLDAAPPLKNSPSGAAQCDAKQWQAFALAQLRRCLAEESNCAKALVAAITAGCTGQEVDDAKARLSMTEWAQLEKTFVHSFLHEEIDCRGLTTRWVPRKKINVVSVEVLLKVGVHPDTSIYNNLGHDGYGYSDYQDEPEWITPLECLALACPSPGEAQKGQVYQQEHPLRSKGKGQQKHPFRSKGKGCLAKSHHQSRAILQSQGNIQEVAKLLLAYGAVPDPGVLSKLGIASGSYDGSGVVLSLYEESNPSTRDPFGLNWMETCLVAVNDCSDGSSDWD